MAAGHAVQSQGDWPAVKRIVMKKIFEQLRFVIVAILFFFILIAAPKNDKGFLIATAIKNLFLNLGWTPDNKIKKEK